MVFWIGLFGSPSWPAFICPCMRGGYLASLSLHGSQKHAMCVHKWSRAIWVWLEMNKSGSTTDLRKLSLFKVTFKLIVIMVTLQAVKRLCK